MELQDWVASLSRRLKIGSNRHFEGWNVWKNWFQIKFNWWRIITSRVYESVIDFHLLRPSELSNSLILIHSILISIPLRAKENSLILEIESPNGKILARSHLWPYADPLFSRAWGEPEMTAGRPQLPKIRGAAGYLNVSWWCAHALLNRTTTVGGGTVMKN